MKRFFSIFFFFALYQGLNAQNVGIEKADSLFSSQKYTEAYYLYETVFDSGYYTDAMLLKMAFIQDGSDNYAEALYFLSLYYNKTGDREVLPKITEIAEANMLSGYSQYDVRYLRILLDKYRHVISVVLILFLLSTSVYFLVSFHKGHKSVIAFGLTAFFVAGLLFVNNHTREQYAIIQSEDTLLRSGPSAAAEPVGFVGNGHKVKVTGHSDVWTEITWEGETAYVRKGTLRII